MKDPLLRPKTVSRSEIPVMNRNAGLSDRPCVAFARLPMSWDLKRPRVETTAVMALCALRAHKPDTSAVPIAATQLAQLARCEPNHLRHRVIKPWTHGPDASGGVVTVHARTIRQRRYQIHDHGRFIKFPAWALTHTGVSRNALVVLAGICSRLDHHDPLRPVTAPYETLAELVTMHLATISTAIAELETAGIITVTRRRGGADHNLPNLYRITWTNPNQPQLSEPRVSANPETTEARVSASDIRTYFSEPSPRPNQHADQQLLQRSGEGSESNPLELLTNKLSNTDKRRLQTQPGRRTLRRRLSERIRQGWTPTQLVNAITGRDLSTANNIAAVLITRTDDLGPAPSVVAAGKAQREHDAHIRRLEVWASVGDHNAERELAQLAGTTNLSILQ